MRTDIRNLSAISDDGRHLYKRSTSGAGNGVHIVDLGDQARPRGPALGGADMRVVVGYLLVLL